MVAPQHAHAPRRALPALAERDYEQEEAGATSQDWISLRAEGGGRGAGREVRCWQAGYSGVRLPRFRGREGRKHGVQNMSDRWPQ